MHYDNEAVFVVGCPRSGTTMLYNLLQAHDEFPLYKAETHLLDICQARHGQLEVPANFRRFMKEFLESEQFARAGLDAVSFRQDAERQKFSWVLFLDFFMSRMARAQGKRRWCDNTPLNALHLADLGRELPNARFIHMIRDGRDVAMSLRKLGWTGLRRGTPLQRLVASAIYWQMVVKSAREAGRHLGDRYIEVRYCDLAIDPKPELEKIGRHLGIELNMAVMSEKPVLKESHGNSAFGDLNGISCEPAQRWRRNMTPEEQVAVNLAIYPTLEELGYGPADPGVLAGEVPQSVKLLCRYYPGFLKLKDYLRTRTALRRFSRSRLEVAKTVPILAALLSSL